MSEVWPFAPEKLSANIGFLTSVEQTFTTEQRAKLRQLFPRVQFKLESIVTKDQTYLAKQIARKAENEYLIPDWRFAYYYRGIFNSSNKTITVDDSFFYPTAGDTVIAWKSPSEYFVFNINSRGVNSVTSLYGPNVTMENFYLMPLLTAHAVGAMKFVEETNNVNKIEITLQTRKYKDLTSYAPSYPVYQTFEVNTDRDILVGNHDGEVIKAVSVVDGETGTVVLEETFDHVDLGSTFSARDNGSSSIISREGWIHKIAGRLKPFWKPTWGSDLIITADALAGATTLSILVNPYSVPADYIGKRFIVDQNGSFSYFQVASADLGTSGYGGTYGQEYGAYVGGVTGTLTLTAGLSVGITVSSIRTVSELNLFRLDADEIAFQYAPGIIATLSVPLIGLDNDL